MSNLLPLILIVDDDPANLRVLCDLLECYGYRIATARSGRDAIDKAQKILPNVILLDVLMPGLDGFATCAEIKMNSAIEQIPVIFLSALDDVQDIVKGFSVGGVDYITKPFKAQEVLARLEHQVRLQLANTEINKLNHELSLRIQQLETALEEKTVLFAEVHHRVKNNLQIVNSLLRMQSQTLDDPKAIEAFQQSQGRIRTMSLIHEKLYAFDNISEINFEQYLTELVTELLETYQQNGPTIQLKLQVDNVSLNLTQAIPCGLIVHELVTNALKYAFANQDSGIIRVALYPIEARLYQLEVEDNGTPTASAGNGFGLKLIKALVRQLRGSLSINESQGTHVSITFPN